ncbi:MAG: hypothetical protein R3B47_04325 [Bacteroidia bacterium]
MLEDATSQTVDKPDNSLAVYATKNGKAVDAWVKVFQAGTKTEVISSRTYQDTGFAAVPAGTYDLPVQRSRSKTAMSQLRPCPGWFLYPEGEITFAM